MRFYTKTTIGRYTLDLFFCLVVFLAGQVQCYSIPELSPELVKTKSIDFYDHPMGGDHIWEVSPPTTKNTHQEFCAFDRPTLSAIQINESNIVWYDSTSNGHPLSPDSPLKDNSTYYAAQLLEGHESAQRLAVSVIVHAPFTPTAPNDVQVFAAGQNPTIGDLEVEQTNVVWYNAPLEGKLLDFDTPLQNGKHYFAAQVFSNCESTHRLMITVQISEPSDLKINKKVSNRHPMIGEKVILTITVENEGLSNFSDIVIKEQLDRGFSYVNAKTSQGNFDPSNQVWRLSSLPAKSTAVLNLEVEATPNGNYSSNSFIETSLPADKNMQNNSAEITLEPSCITIYNEFTPNDDGDNDYFRIDCIETFPESELQIFNRYGALVYQQKAYQNDWRGLANVSGTVSKGNPLPTGTYFYILKTDSLSENKTGWLFLRKD
ncbi:T9SS type B sorting domain-containing protein [Arenibacter echinorum]|uniref:Putative repeat protein (TIGR01451 family)/gliding motility-associated-like protein n=1 Tax=Arenibacter echinorum TaxID=440515 RepID=A0A327QR73_9FLAO|nr:gliding motility-associated C-terminal domain-containing protein [Arenibacter echinorum]RAJ07096.1 putative repeat protein (TIGR01451 family)/gliding motility-associated-like protein [Arenibacter echinorum]